MTISDLPALNATLNGIAAALLVTGYVLIRQGHALQHRRVMLAAFGTSALFLVSYLTYHANAGSRQFPGQGPIRAIYFTILITHVILAAAILPLALITLSRGLRSRFVVPDVLEVPHHKGFRTTKGPHDRVPARVVPDDGSTLRWKLEAIDR
ncbi:MAG: DUF420 domain-containing protein [Acidobacteria bacterium]|nr:DUF420 domain-containing protein [Acidobacteriota bacterium]